MPETFVSDCWYDAPEGYRSSLKDVDDAFWMPLSEAIALLSALPRPSVMPLRQYFAWRCSQGLISAKAGRLVETFGDDPGAIEYLNMPITEEWALPFWSAEHGEHWSTNAARIVHSRSRGRRIIQYLEIAVDREGVELFRQLILAQNEPTPSSVGNGSKGGRPPETDWGAMKLLAENALSAHPYLSRSKLADSLVAEYTEKVSASAPVKRTIERKLAEWNLGATKPVSS